MTRFTRSLALVLAAAPLLGAAAPGAAAETAAAPSMPVPTTAAQPRTLQVTGEGRVNVAPDVAVVTFGVTAIDPSLQRATRDASDRARKLIDVLKGQVAPADLQTARYDVQIERRMDRQGEQPRISGYRVSNEVRATVRDLSKLGALLDRAVAAGANEVQGLALVKDDPSPEQSRALAAAVRAARAKAEEMARAAGVQLGEALQITEGGGEPGLPRPMARGFAMAAAAPVAVEPGQVEVTAQVEVVYAIR